MRIDFSKLQHIEQTSRQAAPLINSLPMFWQRQQPQQQDFKLPSIQQEDQNSISFSVAFPYEVNRRLSPSAINKQLSYLQANRVLPLSTLKFIQNTLQSDRQKSLSPENKDVSRVIDHKQQLSNSKQDILTDKKQEQPREKIILTSNKNSVQISPQKQKIIEIHKCVELKKKPSTKKRVQSKVYSIPIKQPPPKKIQSMQGVTLRPLLNHTRNSRAAKDMIKKRKQHFTSCNSNVFLSLYNDAARYAKKRQIERVIIQEGTKVEEKKSSRVTIATTFEERYQRSLEKQASRHQRARHKMDYDQETGRRYFVPDTTISKMTYLTLFKSTTLVNMFPDDEPRPVRSNYYSRQSSKLNHSPEQLTTTLNRSCELTSSFDNRYSMKNKIPQREGQLAELYANVLWSEDNIRQQELTKEERYVLAKFLQSVAQFQYGRSISRQVFTALFKKHYISLNLFDKAVIDARLKHSRKVKKQAEESIASNQQSFFAVPTARKKQNRFSNLSHASKLYFV